MFLLGLHYRLHNVKHNLTKFKKKIEITLIVIQPTTIFTKIQLLPVLPDI